MPGADLPFPGEGEEILQEIGITPEQVIEKLEQTPAAEKKQTTRQTATLAAQTEVWSWEGRQRARPAARLARGTGSSLSHWDTKQHPSSRSCCSGAACQQPGKAEELLGRKLPPCPRDEMGRREQRAGGLGSAGQAGRRGRQRAGKGSSPAELSKRASQARMRTQQRCQLQQQKGRAPEKSARMG